MPIIFILIAAAGFLFSMAKRGRTNDAWADAARQLGVTLQPAGPVGWPQIVGQFGDVA